MKAVAKLKDEARKYEQKEEWDKAIEAYVQVLKSAAPGEGEAELPLYNRVGDLYVRLGKPAEAVTYYEQAADRYAEAGLYNNAIALCNKALRYQPGRVEVIKKLGQFSAAQGFISDARRWYLEYADRQLKNGKVDDAFAALEDFATVHEDADIREMLGRQLKAHGRKDKAVQTLRRAHDVRLQSGNYEAAEKLKQEILELDPGASFEQPPAAEPPSEPAWTPPAAADVEFSGLSDLSIESAAGAAFGGEVSAEEHGTIELAGLDFGAPAEPAEPAAAAETSGLEGGLIDISTGSPPEPQEFELPSIETEPASGFAEEAGLDLPLEHFDEPAAEAGEPLPLMDFGDTAVEDDLTAEPLPVLEFDSPADSESDGLPAFEIEAIAADLPGFDLPELAMESASATEAPAEAEADDAELRGFEFEAPPSAAAPPAAEPEPSAPPPAEFAPAEAAMAPPEPTAEPESEVRPPERAAPPPARPEPAPPSPAPPARKPEYVDLGALLADDEEDAADARFVVAETAPTGDEDRDFAEMLSQFKDKVAAHLSIDDAAAHYDLGLAFKEMGLIDEAIAEFQTALKGGESRLKVYEELAQCFVLKGQYNVAVTILNRALQTPGSNDDDLIGLYYSLGRAHEGLGQREQAKNAYERVIGLDINFQDAMQRLSQL